MSVEKNLQKKIVEFQVLFLHLQNQAAKELKKNRALERESPATSASTTSPFVGPDADDAPMVSSTPPDIVHFCKGLCSLESFQDYFRESHHLPKSCLLEVVEGKVVRLCAGSSCAETVVSGADASCPKCLKLRASLRKKLCRAAASRKEATRAQKRARTSSDLSARGPEAPPHDDDESYRCKAIAKLLPKILNTSSATIQLFVVFFGLILSLFGIKSFRERVAPFFFVTASTLQRWQTEWVVRKGKEQYQRPLVLCGSALISRNFPT